MGYLFGRRLGAFELLVTGVIAWNWISNTNKASSNPRVAWKVNCLGLRTELYGIERRDVAAHSLHDESSHFVADISIFWSGFVSG